MWPDLQNVRWPLRQRLLASGRANHPGGQIGGLNLRIHEPGIIFEAAVIHGRIGEDEQRDARITPLALYELALNQAPRRGWAGRRRAPGDTLDGGGLRVQPSYQL